MALVVSAVISLNRWLRKYDPNVVNFDKLTYAKLENLTDIESDERYKFSKDIFTIKMKENQPVMNIYILMTVN